ncbi:hypothetical protein TRSC58_07665 [Trypanosoma rangeli SC58]|uniref:Uncharacterized protein n=1 Tax=Trypanosoma rangeli SC58 TaxID=429131 RepID=A0A061ISF5_TRYRA|nr:hypothetical protein TRSC58_07665 [Trypanosoma rangeli SC58]
MFCFVWLSSFVVIFFFLGGGYFFFVLSPPSVLSTLSTLPSLSLSTSIHVRHNFCSLPLVAFFCCLASLTPADINAVAAAAPSRQFPSQ